MQQKIQELKDLLAEIADLNGVIALMDWDQQTYMPNGGAEARARQLGTLGKLRHDRSTSRELGKLIDELRDMTGSMDPASDNSRMIKFAIRDYERETCLTPEFVIERARVTSMAHHAWAEARSKSDFSVFQPHLEKIVDLTNRYIDFFPPADHPYDVLLDIHEPGMKTSDVKKIFDVLRPIQVNLVKNIGEKEQAANSFLYQPFDEKRQWDFGLEVIKEMGFDMERGRQDKSHHPFTTEFSINDVRITTRIDPNFFVP